MPGWWVAVGFPSRPMPMSPVATPVTAPSSPCSTSAAAKPGKISTPSPSACLASQRQTLPRLTTCMPWFLKHAGSAKSGSLYAPRSVRNTKRSSLTGALSGASSSRQFGMSSVSERGSITAPDRMCAPTSEPFSSTQTPTSCWCCAASCFKRIAAASPAGPAPTITTSYCIDSRSAIVFPAVAFRHYRGRRGRPWFEYHSRRVHATPHRRFDGAGVIARDVIAGQEEVAQRCARLRAPEPGRAGEGRALFVDHAMPRRIRQGPELLLQLLVDEARKLVVGEVLVRALRADDGGDDAALTRERAPVERPLQQPAVEAEHGRRQNSLRRIAQVDRVDWLVGESLHRFRSFGQRRNADQECRCMIGGQGTHDVTEFVLVAVGAYGKPRVTLIYRRDAMPGPHGTAFRAHVVRSGVGEEPREVDPRQQQIACLAASAETVAKHIEEDLCRGGFGRGVERGDAQREPEQAHEGAALTLIFEERNDRRVPLQSVVPPPHPQQETHRGEPLGEGRPAGGQQSGEKMEGRRQADRPQREAVVDTPGERNSKKKSLGIGADEPHQAQRFRVGAEQDVQAVVEREIAVLDPPRATPERFCRLEYRDRHPMVGERHCRRHAGVASADDGNVHEGAVLPESRQLRWPASWRACLPRSSGARRRGLRISAARCVPAPRGAAPAADS